MLNQLLSKLKPVTAQLLIVAVLVQASLLYNIVTAPSAGAQGFVSGVVINEVLVDPDTSTAETKEKVELYNSSSTTVDISGWKLVDSGTNVFKTIDANTQLASGAYITFDRGGSLLNNDGDSVIMIDTNSSQVDKIEYGKSQTATIPAPDKGKTISRNRDGSDTWIANTATTFGTGAGFANAIVDFVLPTSMSVNAGVSNAKNVVNSLSKTAVTSQLQLSEPVKGATVQYFGAVLDTPVSTNTVGATFTLSGGNYINALDLGPADLSGLTDGTVTLRGYVENPNGIRSVWFSGTTTTKDTTPPVLPVITTPTAAFATISNTLQVTGTVAEQSTINAYNDFNKNGSVDSNETTPLSSALSNGTSFSVNAGLTLDAQNNFLVTATDAMGNQSGSVAIATVTQDSTGPVTPQINSKDTAVTSDGKVVLSWTPSSSSDVAFYNVYWAHGNNAIDVSMPVTTVTAQTNVYMSKQLPNGMNHFVVRAVDAVGNHSSNSEALTLQVTSPLNENNVTGPGQVVDLVKDFGLQLATGVNTQGATKFEVTNYRNDLPAGQFPDGLTFLGQYFELKTNNNTVFPVEIRYYYTATQLTAAGVDENQLTGIYFYDQASLSWKAYTDAGVKRDNVIINGVEYSGYVWANADHFTPIAIAADKTAPTTPANLKAISQDAKATLTWSGVNDAVGYVVRYRKATNDDSKVAYTEVFVSGKSQTELTIKNLDNNTLYEFGVAAQDAVANTSDFAVVNQTPQEPAKVSEPQKNNLILPQPAIVSVPSVTVPQTTGLPDATGGEVNPVYDLTPDEEQIQDADVPQIAQKETPTEEKTESNPVDTGEIKGGQDETDQSASRGLVTFLIILAAAAAGFGGYYGYQWWIERPEQASAPRIEVRKKGKKAKKNRNYDNRW